MTDSSAPRKPVRVLIADDSELSRLVLADLLSADPGIEVVGTAASGLEAVEQTIELEPDIITMDLHMPGLDGIEATQRIMKRRATPVIIVTSSGFWQRREEVFAAFKYGVLDVIEKPGGAHDQRIVRNLIDKVKLLCRVEVTSDVWPRLSRRPQHLLTACPPAAERKIIVIGSSTGGPKAVQEVLAPLPTDLDTPVLLAQHMSKGFVSGFGDWLDSNVELDVRVATPGDKPRPGCVLVAPGGTSMVVDKRGIIRTTDQPPPQNVLPSVDLLFSSVAESYGAGAIGVVLTGIGKDGRQGMIDIHRAGGVTLIQDEASCVVFGMPGAALDAGVVDEVVLLNVMAVRLTELCRLSGGHRSG